MVIDRCRGDISAHHLMIPGDALLVHVYDNKHKKHSV